MNVEQQNGVVTPQAAVGHGAETRQHVGTKSAPSSQVTAQVTELMPVAVRRQLNDLLDELWTKIKIEFYKDASDAVFKSLVE
jgi:predicted ATP-dependent Lon-type protease